MNENVKYIIATIGVIILGISFAIYFYYDDISFYFAKNQTKEVHVHSDFSFSILGSKVDLTGAKYQSNTKQILHKYMHFHDGVDTMIHRHADNITLREFLNSLGFILTNTCVTTDTGMSYCSDATNTLKLFVNGTSLDDISSYIPQEKDQILLYYGINDMTQIIRLQEEITDEACLYSGTCPERGEPPFESCGLTCEI